MAAAEALFPPAPDQVRRVTHGAGALSLDLRRGGASRRWRKAAAWCWAGATELLGSEEDLVAPAVRWARGVMAALVAVAGGSACRRRLDPGAAALEGGGG